jgi:N-acetyl-gamma-glutamyl-phosphate reductase
VPCATRDTYGSNTVQVTARYDARTGYVVSLAALDNLVKGGAGQAIQAANLAVGLEETVGLPTLGLVP